MIQNYYLPPQHDFDYLLVLDFECTCEQNVQIDPQEIIEFPIIVIDLGKNQILEEKFHLYLKPVFRPILSEFCKNLTHITQEKVDHGTDLSVALEQLDVWLHETGIINSRFTFVTVGSFDLQVFLKKECKLKGINQRGYLRSFVNLIYKFRNFFGLKYNLGLRGMMSQLKIEFLGTQHSGIDDAYNTAVLISNMVQRGALFKMSDVWYIDYFQSPHKQDSHPRYSQNYNAQFSDDSDPQDFVLQYNTPSQEIQSQEASLQNSQQNNSSFISNSQFLVSTPSSTTSNTSFSNSNEFFFIDFSFEENGPKLKKKQKKTKSKPVEKPPEQQEITN